MPRIKRTNVDYYPHSATFRNDRRVKAIRSAFGVAGYGLVIILTEILADSEHFTMSVNDLELELLAGDIGVTTDLLATVLEKSVRLGLFQLSADHALTSQDLLTSLEPVLEKRRRADTSYQNTRTVHSVTDTSVSVTDTPVSVTESTQSRVKESKSNKDTLVLQESNTEVNFPPTSVAVDRVEIYTPENLEENLFDEQKKEDPPPPPPKKPKSSKSPKPPTIVSRIRAEVERLIPDTYWTGKEGDNAAQLVRKLTSRLKNRNKEPTDDLLYESFVKLVEYCNNPKTPDYFRFSSISKLNSTYNDLIAREQNGKPENARSSIQGSKDNRFSNRPKGPRIPYRDNRSNSDQSS